MSNKKKNNNSNKKNTVMKQNQKRKASPLSMGIIAALVAFIAIFIFNSLGTNKQNQAPKSINSSQFSNSQNAVPQVTKAVYKKVQAQDGFVELHTSLFDDGQAKYFTYASSGKNINFFALKSSDDVIRVAFDSCDVCYAAKKGYRQEGDIMVCNNCGQQFPSVLINVEQGGCNPAPLERNIVADKLVLNVSNIDMGKRFF